ncbi:glycosyltransferase family 2 protein [Chitinophaga silvisoli]|uniref:Glycosyltransferase family 2 protein n=1 Tax=Chitinophaga silvisoli TaxID=2291814 RepID=A0A3E1NT84_9BACT|nr:glycosyltransferase family 2 protein [Chitinophaga silvisoli]RFM30978.1 glycosyltransferase family 2 protein [Chitinophaga silvisoli]
MINGKKILVVLPAYNAGKTLKITYDEIDRSLVDDVILVDDASKDNTVAVAKEIGIVHIICHEKNKGYGGNQKSCYKRALELGADIIIMLHPDYQYTPLLIEAMASIIAKGVYPVVLGSRILGRGALKGGMPYYKYFFNRFLTISQNTLMRQKLSEYHTGYRAFDRSVLEAIPWESNSDDFVFDNEMLGQICYKGFEIAEVTCPTKYFEEASSINFRRSAVYGMGVLAVSLKCFLQRTGLAKFKLFDGITPEVHVRGKKQFLPPVERSEPALRQAERITSESSHS